MASRTNDLTPKQQTFCRSVVAGQSLSDSYKSAYSASRMSNGAVYVEASRLMTNPKVTLRVEALNRVKDRAVVASAITDQQRVLTKLRYLMDHAVPSDSAKLRAAELLGKSIGLFKDVQVQQEPEQSSEEIQKELEELLARYEVKVVPDDAVH